MRLKARKVIKVVALTMRKRDEEVEEDTKVLKEGRNYQGDMVSLGRYSCQVGISNLPGGRQGISIYMGSTVVHVTLSFLGNLIALTDQHVKKGLCEKLELLVNDDFS